MPAKSKAQYRFMKGCAENPQSMKGDCPDTVTAREYAKGDFSRLPKHAMGARKRMRKAGFKD